MRPDHDETNPMQDERPGDGERGARRVWSAPTLERLPKLTDLTLVTAESIDGEGDVGGGSTVFF